jgi:prepilin-type processing-associated H-X9-DG protein
LRRNPSEPRVQIPLSYFFYGTAVVAVSIATFGLGGMVTGIAIVVFWAWVFLRGTRSRSLMEALGATSVLFCLCGLMLPVVDDTRGAARRMQCSNHLKMISLALHNYHAVYSSFPPAYIADADGRPMHSWRVLILPFIEEQRLYDQYRFDEPWDGPNNRALATRMPGVYGCPSHTYGPRGAQNMTSYAAVLGAETAWPMDQGRKLSELTDGSSNTLLLIESHGGPTHWMQPQDLMLEEAVAALDSPKREDYGHIQDGFFYNAGFGRNIAMADGSVAFAASLPQDAAMKLLGVANGASSPSDWSYGYEHYRKPNYANWFRLVIFLLVLLLPLPWVWLRSNEPISSHAVCAAKQWA